MPADVPPGTFIAAVGADSQGKQELEPALVASATLIVDVLAQCAEIGELQHVLAAGLLTRAQVHAELADVVVGRRPAAPGREITIFDSSGRHCRTSPRRSRSTRRREPGRGVEVKLDD